MKPIDYQKYSEEKRNLYYRCIREKLDYAEEHQKLINKYFNKEGTKNG